MTRKRGHGEGNIYQRADGRWAARLSVGYSGGKRARRWVYGKTRAEVGAKLRSVILAHEQGLLVSPGRLTVQQFLTRWLAESVEPKVRPRTFASYAQLCRLHIYPALGPVSLRKLGPQQIQTLLNALQRSGLSPRTVQYVRAVLRSGLAQALKWGVVSQNAAALVSGPRVPRKSVQTLDPDQARKLLEAMAGHRFGALVSVALGLGLRQGEALGLKWDAVDLDAALLHVRVALQRIGRGWTLVEPKSERSRRSIALPAFAVLALRSHRVRQLEQRMLSGSAWTDQGFVFTNRDGGPLESRNVTKAFQRVLRELDLPTLRFHDLRHTAATLLLAQGVDVRTIMETLGHSQISLTLNTYSHVLPKLQRQAAERMDQLLGS